MFVFSHKPKSQGNPMLSQYGRLNSIPIAELASSPDVPNSIIRTVRNVGSSNYDMGSGRPSLGRGYGRPTNSEVPSVRTLTIIVVKKAHYSLQQTSSLSQWLKRLYNTHS